LTDSEKKGKKKQTGEGPDNQFATYDDQKKSREQKGKG